MWKLEKLLNISVHKFDSMELNSSEIIWSNPCFNSREIRSEIDLYTPWPDNRSKIKNSPSKVDRYRISWMFSIHKELLTSQSADGTDSCGLHNERLETRVWSGDIFTTETRPPFFYFTIILSCHYNGSLNSSLTLRPITPSWRVFLS